ncbi:hypothetical protein Tco_0525753 [Tanacetum coccineum]
METYLNVLAEEEVPSHPPRDAAEGVRDAIGFGYCLASSSGWTKAHVLMDRDCGSILIGPELVQETTEKAVVLRKSCIPSQAQEILKDLCPVQKKGKLAPRYVGPFEILERIGPIAYRLRLPEELNGVHDTFHVSNLKKCLGNANLHVPLNEIKIDKTLNFVEELVEIIDREFID